MSEQKNDPDVDSLLAYIHKIRVAAGDPQSKLMQDELVQRIADHSARVADLEHRLANCDADLFAMQEAKQAAERKVAALQAFAHDVMTSWPEGDVDGGALQEYAEKHGLIVPQEVMEPCGDDCVCAGYGEFPMTCYRKTDLLQGQPT